MFGKTITAAAFSVSILLIFAMIAAPVEAASGMPLGYGLSYASFAYSDFAVKGGDTVTASLTVTNTGQLAGADVPQVYLTQAPGEKRQRLLGFERVELKPGQSRRVTINADPRLLAHFDAAAGTWKIAAGRYTVALATDAQTFAATTDADLKGRAFGR